MHRCARAIDPHFILLFYILHFSGNTHHYLEMSTLRSSFVVFTAFLMQYYINGVHGTEPCFQSQRDSVRLSGLNSSYVGYVQVCKDGYWVDIVYEEEEEWSRKNSIVACRELGFQGSVRIFSQAGIPPAHVPEVSTPLQYLSVKCTGIEQKLSDCVWTFKNTESKTSNIIALCKEDPYDSEVMVVGVSGEDSEGIVALYNPLKTYRWSTICTTEWDDTDADVVCRQLGFSSGTSKSYRIEQVVDSKLLPNKLVSEFRCSGSEDQLSECSYLRTFPQTLCSSEYAGIICITEPSEPNENTLDLTTILLILVITTILLLIAILLVVLKYVLKRFRSKPLSSSASVAPRTRRDRASTRTLRSENRSTQIIRTQLDPDVPYAVTAPPSYAETILADSRVQERSDEEATLILSDTLSNSSDSEHTSV